MKLASLLAFSSAALLTVGACSEKTDQRAQDTANSAGRDIEAAADRTRAAIDAAAKDASAKAGNAGDRLEQATDDAGDNIANSADKATKKAGNALERAGKDLQH